MVEIFRKFKHIIFFDNGHYYIDTTTGNVLTSVTQIISKYKKPFDREYWLKVKATQRGISVEELSAEWDELKRYGLTRGNIVHNYLEYQSSRKVFELNIPVDFKEEFSILKKQCDNFLNDFKDWLFISEFVIGNGSFGGMIDNLAISPNNKLYILDYKTDKKFRETSQYKLTRCLSHVDDCELAKYTIQTNMYRELLGEDVEGIKVIWFFKDNPNYIIKEIPLIDTKFIFDDYKSKNSFS